MGCGQGRWARVRAWGPGHGQGMGKSRTGRQAGSEAEGGKQEHTHARLNLKVSQEELGQRGQHAHALAALQQ